jgi:hypothetical protein
LKGAGHGAARFRPPTTPDAAQDDREERILFARWLGELLSIRSDIFTAYVKIEGYPVSDFREGPVESARFIAVFDRSRVKNRKGPVELVAMHRFD